MAIKGCPQAETSAKRKEGVGLHPLHPHSRRQRQKITNCHKDNRQRAQRVSNLARVYSRQVSAVSTQTIGAK